MNPASLLHKEMKQYGNHSTRDQNILFWPKKKKVKHNEQYPIKQGVMHPTICNFGFCRTFQLGYFCQTFSSGLGSEGLIYYQTRCLYSKDEFKDVKRIATPSNF